MNRLSANLIAVISIIGMTWTCAHAQEIHDPARCPTITMSSADDMTLAINEPLKFSVTVTDVDPKLVPTFEWKVTGGSITSGQGTTEIWVERTGADGDTITASVEVSGLPDKCPNTASASQTTFVCGLISPAQKFDEYGDIKFRQARARLDNFAIELQNTPTATGYIIVYAGSDARRDEVNTRALRVEEYLIRSRGIDPERVASIYGGNRKQKTVELFIVPVGADKPVPSAAIDSGHRNP